MLSYGEAMAATRPFGIRRVMTPNQVVAYNVIKARALRGWTQEQLAERAEMNASYLGFVERGDNVPTLTIIIQIAEGLGVGADELVREVMQRR